jgi:hypothetical protein
VEDAIATICNGDLSQFIVDQNEAVRWLVNKKIISCLLPISSARSVVTAKKQGKLFSRVSHESQGGARA